MTTDKAPINTAPTTAKKPFSVAAAWFSVRASAEASPEAVVDDEPGLLPWLKPPPEARVVVASEPPWLADAPEPWLLLPEPWLPAVCSTCEPPAPGRFP